MDVYPGNAPLVNRNWTYPLFGRRIETRERKDLEFGNSTGADVAEITKNRLEAEVMLMKAKKAKPSPDVAVLERRLSEVERKLDQIPKRNSRNRPRHEAVVVSHLDTGQIADLM